MDKIPQTISATIDVFSEKFGKVGTDLWNSMVLGTRVDCIGGFSLGIILVIFGILLFGKDDKNNSGIIFLSLMFIFIGILFIAFNFTGMFVPEYTLINSIIRSN